MLPLVSFADTLDYWSVYINDSLIAKYNSISTDNSIILNKKLIEEYDTISIKYGNDHPCSKCEYYFAVKDKDNGIKIHVERSKYIYKKINFPISKLKEFKHSNEFEFFVYEDRFLDDKNYYTLLVKLKIE